jgi:hypothetical protein
MQRQEWHRESELLCKFLHNLQQRLALRNFQEVTPVTGSDSERVGDGSGAFGLVDSKTGGKPLQHLDLVGFMDGLRRVGQTGDEKEVKQAAAVAQGLLRVMLIRGEDLGLCAGEVSLGHRG